MQKFLQASKSRTSLDKVQCCVGCTSIELGRGGGGGGGEHAGLEMLCQNTVPNIKMFY